MKRVLCPSLGGRCHRPPWPNDAGIVACLCAICVLIDTDDPHLFYDDIAAVQEEDAVVVDSLHEAATDVEDTGSISAELNEGVEEHAVVGDIGFDDDQAASKMFNLVEDVCDDDLGVAVQKTS